MKQRPGQKVLAVVGPTAAGKSEAAVGAALCLGRCEIISADSMQIYRHMDLGTAKPETHLLEAVPHHLIDIIDPDQDFSAAEYQRLSRGCIDDITGRQTLPILVGGSGLYIRAAF